jgi:putative transposase
VKSLAFRRRLQEAAVRWSNGTYRRSSHTVYQLHYHFVFITKYRKPVLRDSVGSSLRDLIREICRTNDIEIIRGHVRPDHVHLLLSVPPDLSPSRVMQLSLDQISQCIFPHLQPLIIVS